MKYTLITFSIIATLLLSSCPDPKPPTKPIANPVPINQPIAEDPNNNLPLPTVKPAPANYPEAIPVPEKPGFVLSPYNNEVVDVEGLKSGTLAADPRYPLEEKKYFVVP